ncbi:alpha-L-fucosidase [Thaumasiovibrio sp. DFM-14]|uniref:alpha-L-fucosidase n=1 Tax=Thaumasiovibrio sp. DFM-14 TaxID=3384792 RepID=UPI0039A0BC13
MNKFALAKRQVHLDFHTSSLIPDVAIEFNVETFIQQLSTAGVNSITCFGRCHHGMLYYPSNVHQDAIHPHLANRDLLAEQLGACKKAGIKAPIYLTIQWDQLQSESHPEWCMQDRHGGPIVADWSKPGYYHDGFYTFLCINSPYRQFVFEEVSELQEMYDVDGFFFDITYVKDCHCQHCRNKMVLQGIDLLDEKATLAFAAQSLADFKQELSARIRSKKPEATVYYNTSHVHPGYHRFIDALSHIEVESLPSGGWGYDHFPVVGRYARTLGKPVMGMTGKFHTYWGDFHSLKNTEALEYECFLINALNASCSIGDQMHPDGQLSKAGYELIGRVYNQLAELEPYCTNAVPVVELAILNPEEGILDADLDVSRSLIGATRLLQEAGFQFDIIDSLADLSHYRLLILVDDYPLTPEIAARLDNYVTNGGKLLAAGSGPFTEDNLESLIADLGVIPKGEIPYSPDYFVPRGELSHLAKDHSVPAEETAMYLGGVKVAAKENSKVLGDTYAPYFNRQGRNFCSHQHTPSSHKVSHPALVRTERTAYFSNPVFTLYGQKAPRAVRSLVADQCRSLLEETLIEHNGPASLLVTLNHQPDEQRYVLHLLHYVPETKCSDLLIVDSILPLHDLTIKVNLPRIKTLSTTRAGEQITQQTITERDVTITVGKLNGYQLITLDY